MNNKGFFKGMITGAALVIILCGIIFGTLKAVDIIKYGTGNGVTTVGKQSISEKMKTIEKLIDENAYFDIDPEKVESGIYKGLVSGLDDDYAAYMTPDEQRMESEQVQGEYRGMGITMSYKQASGSEIQSVYEGSPAERVGLKAKDVITEADGVSYVEKSTTELAYYVRTSEKESVSITVYRPSTKETLKFEVPLEKIDIPTVEGEMVEGNIGYIRISNFHQITKDQFEKKFKELASAGMKGLVIDLRGNPGGLVSTTLEMLDFLLPECDTLTMEAKDKSSKTFTSDEDHALEVPCTILINGSSASAAEIFAGAMQDNKKAVLVGEKSYGKGIVQGTFPFADGSAVKLTIAKYYTPAGNDIHKQGIMPDIEVKNSETEDLQLMKALEKVKEMGSTKDQ